jgi:hypothetical protein
MRAASAPVDESSIKDVPGIVKVVRDGDFLGVVASNEWAAIRGARDLKATWSKAETLPDQAKLWDYVRSTKVPAPHFRSGPDKSRITNPLVTGSLLDRFYRYTCEPLSTSRLRRLGPAQRPPFANSRLRHRAYDSVI